jgi:hypothetical protein
MYEDVCVCMSMYEYVCMCVCVCDSRQALVVPCGDI